MMVRLVFIHWAVFIFVIFLSGTLNWNFLYSFIFFLERFFPSFSSPATVFSLVSLVLLALGPMGWVSLCGPSSRRTWKSAFCPTLNPAPMRLSWPKNYNIKITQPPAIKACKCSKYDWRSNGYFYSYFLNDDIAWIRNTRKNALYTGSKLKSVNGFITMSNVVLEIT